MKTEKPIVMLAILAGLSGVWGARWACAAETASTPPAEQAGWTLAFRDDFNRSELGENWKVLDGQWIVKDGWLRGTGTLIAAHGFPEDNSPAFQRLEFDAVTDVQPIIFFKNKPKPRVVVGDLSSFLQVRVGDSGKFPWTSGYFFQFGGQNNEVNRIQRAKVDLQVDWHPKTLITSDKLHLIVAENDQGHVRLIVDGIVVLDAVDKQFLLGEGQDRMGFFFYTAAKVDQVKVYVKRPR
jgi:hypothetical protein